jgi:hypothetical protein
MSDNSSNSSSNNQSQHHTTKGQGVIRGGSGKVLYDSDKDKDDFKSNSIIYSGDGRRVLYEDKE